MADFSLEDIKAAQAAEDAAAVVPTGMFGITPKDVHDFSQKYGRFMGLPVGLPFMPPDVMEGGLQHGLNLWERAKGLVGQPNNAAAFQAPPTIAGMVGEEAMSPSNYIGMGTGAVLSKGLPVVAKAASRFIPAINDFGQTAGRVATSAAANAGAGATTGALSTVGTDESAADKAGPGALVGGILGTGFGFLPNVSKAATGFAKDMWEGLRAKGVTVPEWMMASGSNAAKSAERALTANPAVASQSIAAKQSPNIVRAVLKDVASDGMPPDLKEKLANADTLDKNVLGPTREWFRTQYNNAVAGKTATIDPVKVQAARDKVLELYPDPMNSPVANEFKLLDDWATNQTTLTGKQVQDAASRLGSEAHTTFTSQAPNRVNHGKALDAVAGVYDDIMTSLAPELDANGVNKAYAAFKLVTKPGVITPDGTLSLKGYANAARRQSPANWDVAPNPTQVFAHGLQHVADYFPNSYTVPRGLEAGLWNAIIHPGKAAGGLIPLAYRSMADQIPALGRLSQGGMPGVVAGHIKGGPKKDAITPDFLDSLGIKD